MHDADGLRAMLAGCLDIPRWVEQVAAGAPYASREQLQEAGRTAADPLTPQEIEQAVAAHPRIGDGTTSSATSRAEQDAALTAGDEWATAMATANSAYEERFGRIFVIRAAGRGADEMLREAQRRLTLSPEEDLAELGVQLREIAVLRLGAGWDRVQETQR